MKVLVASCLFGAALLGSGCAATPDPATVTADRERIDREYRPGSHFPKRREAGVETLNRDAVERQQQVGPPGGYVSPHAPR
jgi:hypothetical protein